jgi:hypothetical protein
MRLRLIFADQARGFHSAASHSRSVSSLARASCSRANSASVLCRTRVYGRPCRLVSWVTDSSAASIREWTCCLRSLASGHSKARRLLSSRNTRRVSHRSQVHLRERVHVRLGQVLNAERTQQHRRRFRVRHRVRRPQRLAEQPGAPGPVLSRPGPKGLIPERRQCRGRGPGAWHVARRHRGELINSPGGGGLGAGWRRPDPGVTRPPPPGATSGPACCPSCPRTPTRRA